jgi:ABC-type sugar transport system substrate-binding protein
LILILGIGSRRDAMLQEDASRVSLDRMIAIVGLFVALAHLLLYIVIELFGIRVRKESFSAKIFNFVRNYIRWIIAVSVVLSIYLFVWKNILLIVAGLVALLIYLLFFGRRPPSDITVTPIIKPRVALFVPRCGPNSKSGKSGYSNSFWIEFEEAVFKLFKENGYDPDPEHTDFDYDENNQLDKLQQYDWAKVEGAIVAPAGEKVLDYLELKDKEGKCIVIHDVTPRVWNKYFSERHGFLPNVSVDNELGGLRAAEIMYTYFQKPQVKKAMELNILLIPGHPNHAHSRDRINNFRIKLYDLTGDNVKFLEIKKNCNWNFDNCKEACEEYLTPQTISRIKKIHGIFACNDEMALAAQAVITERLRDLSLNREVLKGAVIVGFDYIGAVRRELKNRNSMFIGTVNAHIEDQAQKVVELYLSAKRLNVRTTKDKMLHIIEPTNEFNIPKLKR